MAVRSPASLVVAVLLLAGCSSTSLPYKPNPQPRGAKVSAAYQVVGDRLRIELDTGGHRLEQAWIMKPDGAAVAVETVENPPVVSVPPPSISVGGGSFGGSYGRGVGVGVGSGGSVGFPLGEGSVRTQGNTIVWFPLVPAGPEPWLLYVKLAGIQPTTFPVGGPISP